MSERDFDELTDPGLAAAFRAFGDEAVRTFEPRQVAQAAMSAGATGPWWSQRRRPLPLLEGHRGVAWAAVLLLAALALVAGGLLAGALIHRPPIAPPVSGAGCDVLDPLAARAGAVDGGGWPTARAPGARSQARPGLLAGWVNYAPAGSEMLDLDLALLDPGTGVATRLTHFDKAFSSQAGQIGWSPDGSALAFSFDDHGQCSNLYVATADGSRLVRPARDTQSEYNAWFAWAPDGSALATIHGRPASPPAEPPSWTSQPSTTLQLVPRDGTPALDLGSPCEACAPVNTPVWSPDGALIASTFQRRAPGSGTIGTWGIAITASNRIGWTVLSEGPASDAGYLAPIGWRDARTILATRPGPGGNGVELVTLSVDAPGVPTSTDVVLPFDPIAVSPDGRSVVEVTGAWAADSTPQHQEVEVVDLGTGTSRMVWTSGIGIEVYPAWSPDGRALAIGAIAYPGGDTSRAGVWIVSVDGTGLRRVGSEPMEVVWQPIWP